MISFSIITLLAVAVYALFTPYIAATTLALMSILMLTTLFSWIFGITMGWYRSHMIKE